MLDWIKALSINGAGGTNPPENLGFEIINYNNVDLTWNAGSAGALSYKIFKDGNFLAEVDNVTFTTTTYLDETI